MRKPIFPIKALLIASALVAAPSCADKEADVEHLPRAPEKIEKAQAEDQRPLYPVGDVSEAEHESWVDDALDWGDRKNLLAYRWCTLWNTFAAEKTDCGPAPEGAD